MMYGGVRSVIGVSVLIQLAYACLSATAKLPAKVRVKSVRQTIVAAQEYLFEGQVDFLLETKLHLFADRLFLDEVNKTARAQADGDGLVLMQDDQLTIFARQFFINIETGEVTVHDARVQVPEGFFVAQELFRDEAGTWLGREMTYTPCDAYRPHWQIKAAQGAYTPSSLKLKNIKFLVNQQPVAWAPGVYVPLYKKSNSGFLLPRLSYDYRYGPGVRQDYYWYLHEHADITTGVDWKNERGVFGTGELRWASNKEHNGFFTTYAGYAQQVYVQRRDAIIKTGKPQFWIEGNHVLGSKKLPYVDYASLLTKIDAGTDKRVGYEFFDRLEDVEDTSFNGMIGRGYNEYGLLQASVDVGQTTRKRFLLASPDALFAPAELASFVLDDVRAPAVQEFDNNSRVMHLPQIAWTGVLKKIGNFGVQRNFMVDYVHMHEQEVERIFLQSKLAHEDRVIPRAQAQAVRLEYGVDMSVHLPSRFGTLYAHAIPQLGIRSQVYDVTQQQASLVTEHALFTGGAYRALVQFNAGYTAPALELLDSAGEVAGHLRPRLYMRMSPVIEQRNWPLFDQYDRRYPTREIGGALDYTISLGDDRALHGYVAQGYDLVPQALWFAPRRTNERHLTALSYGVQYQNKSYFYRIDQEFCPVRQRLLTSFVHAKMAVAGCDLYAGYLFQDQSVSRTRRLLTQSPHSFFVGADIPFGQHVKLGYTGFFVTESTVGQRVLLVQPVKHEVRLEYRGHCWGVYLGVEEKMYRQYGNTRHERAFVLSMYIDSLGSFAKKIKNNNELISSSVGA